jgi:hypothetical protein
MFDEIPGEDILSIEDAVKAEIKLPIVLFK